MNVDAIQSAIRAWIISATGLAESQVIHEAQGGDRPSGIWIGIGMSIESVGQDWLNTVDNPLVIADDVVEVVDFANNKLQLTGHQYVTADGPFNFETTGVLPTGIELLKNYWAIVLDADNIQIADSFLNAIAAVPVPVAFSDAGSGVHTIKSTSTTVRAGKEINHTARGTRLLTITLQVYNGAAAGTNRPFSILNSVVLKRNLPSIADALEAAGIGIATISPIQELNVTLGPVPDRRGLVTITAHLADEVSETGTYIERATLVQDPPIS